MKMTLNQMLSNKIKKQINLKKQNKKISIKITIIKFETKKKYQTPFNF
jgi:hypothetical protein